MNIESEEEETIHWIALNQLVIYKEGREKCIKWVVYAPGV